MMRRRLQSDEKLFVFEEKCKPLSGLQASNWRFRKMHELPKFTDFIRRCGSARWFSTGKRGEAASLGEEVVG
jgi:hypothetical protein